MLCSAMLCVIVVPASAGVILAQALTNVAHQCRSRECGGDPSPLNSIRIFVLVVPASAGVIPALVPECT